MSHQSKTAVVVKGRVYVQAEEPPEAPSEEEMVQTVEESPAAKWREYLQPIIMELRNQFGLEHGSVSLLNPRIQTPAGTSTLGFNIVGHIRFQPDTSADVVEKYGFEPYKFTATVTPQGNLASPITIQGSKG